MTLAFIRKQPTHNIQAQEQNTWKIEAKHLIIFEYPNVNCLKHIT